MAAQLWPAYRRSSSGFASGTQRAGQAAARALSSDAAPVAQLDRAKGFYPFRCRFESCRGHQRRNRCQRNHGERRSRQTRSATSVSWIPRARLGHPRRPRTLTRRLRRSRFLTVVLSDRPPNPIDRRLDLLPSQPTGARVMRVRKEPVSVRAHLSIRIAPILIEKLIGLVRH